VSVVVIGEGRVAAFEPGTLKLDEGEYTAIFYDRPLEAMGLAGELALAPPGTPPDDVWPLPPSARAVRFDGTVIDPAPILATTLLPRPSCGALEVVSTTELPAAATLRDR